MLDTFDPAYRETAKANFLAMARGGESREYLFLTCFADYAVTNFLLGTGTTPTTVTVAYDRRGEAAAYELYVREHAAGTYGSDPLQTRGAYEAGLQAQVVAAEASLSAELGGREAVVFLAPIGAHHAIGFEAWQAVASWAVVTDDDNVVQAVRDDTPAGEPEHTQPLATLASRITTAAASDAHAATRVTTVGGLSTYYRDTLRAYDDITLGDGETTTFTPAQPPPAPTCTNGTVIPNPGDQRALVKDCETLLAAKDSLRGTGTALSSWTGVTTGGTPTRVTGLNLASQGLTGTIPPGLGRLYGLTSLNLSTNSLTGAIPAEVGWLDQLTELRLAGNSLTGCLSLALTRIPTNDLGALALPVCGPPPPTGLSAGAPDETSVPLTWAAVPGAATYRVEYRLQGATAWTLASDTLTAPAHTVPGLQCGTTYEFRVSAYGDGTAYTAAWGAAFTAVTATTGACPLPAPAAPTSLTAGTVTATSVPLTWAAVANASKYRVESRVSGAETWTVADDTLTGATHTVDGLTCGTAYEFRVSAYGDGTTLAAAWGTASTVVSATTSACPPPADPAVAFALAFSRMQEGASVTVTVNLSAAPSSDLTIPLTVLPGTAEAADATGVPASVTFNSGTTTASFLVTAVQDQVAESAPETLYINFGMLPAGITAAQPAQHLLVITDAPSARSTGGVARAGLTGGSPPAPRGGLPTSGGGDLDPRVPGAGRISPDLG